MNTTVDPNDVSFKSRNDVVKDIVGELRQAAEENGTTFAHDVTDDYLVRRVRGFYKNRLQKAKKRLAAMMKHPESLENQRTVSAYIRCACFPDLSFEDSMTLTASTNMNPNPFELINSSPTVKFILTRQMTMKVAPCIKDGFNWESVPACEEALFKHLHKYFDISLTNDEQLMYKFLNFLVKEVRKAAHESGVFIYPDISDEYLHHRIQGFYKFQRKKAKERLDKLKQHPESLENKRILSELIQRALARNHDDLTFDDGSMEEDSMKMGPSNTMTDAGSDKENTEMKINVDKPVNK